MADDHDDNRGDNVLPVPQPPPQLRSVSTGFDPFDLENDGGYDESKFYVRAVDKRGHKEVVHLALPPSLFALVHELAGNPTLPDYRTAQDFVRDAITHRAHYIAHDLIRSQRLEQKVARETYFATLEELRNEMLDLNRTVSDTEDTIMQARHTGDPDVLAQTIQWANTIATQLREPYCQKVLDIVKKYDG